MRENPDFREKSCQDYVQGTLSSSPKSWHEESEKWGFSRTLGDDASFLHVCSLGGRLYAALRTRARSSSNPARPYICRLIVFSRFTCPSTGPLLHLAVTAAVTADSS